VQFEGERRDGDRDDLVGEEGQPLGGHRARIGFVGDLAGVHREEA
jgi:hypothetical protein